MQRRTLEGVATWMARVKPLTTGRSLLAPGEIEVTDASWWRAWRTSERIVVVTDEVGATVRVPDGGDVLIVPLPA